MHFFSYINIIDNFSYITVMQFIQRDILQTQEFSSIISIYFNSDNYD